MVLWSVGSETRTFHAKPNAFRRLQQYNFNVVSERDLKRLKYNDSLLKKIDSIDSITIVKMAPELLLDVMPSEVSIVKFVYLCWPCEPLAVL